MVDAVERRNALLETEKYQGKNLQVNEARNPVDPRKPHVVGEDRPVSTKITCAFIFGHG